MNVPALSDCSLRRDIASSDFTTGPEIQVCSFSIVLVDMLTTQGVSASKAISR